MLVRVFTIVLLLCPCCLYPPRFAIPLEEGAIDSVALHLSKALFSLDPDNLQLHYFQGSDHCSVVHSFVLSTNHVRRCKWCKSLQLINCLRNRTKRVWVILEIVKLSSAHLGWGRGVSDTPSRSMLQNQDEVSALRTECDLTYLPSFVFISEDLSRRVCRFFQTRSGCWRGDQCPNLHVKRGR